jgi:pyruvate/2-oxoglutarate dehydrogenase complex dihydrolipoamide dehydrogenase (E3) component/uncharacterized membrane protein YdjX (TVP38/TMEM64 family)
VKRPALIIAVLIGAVLLYLLLGPEHPDLYGLRARVEALRAYQSAHPLFVAAAFFLAYVAVTALSLPLAVWMTLAAGALFGFWTAIVIVSFAASIGATLAFLAARYALRDWVEARFGARLETINRGLERDGVFYLFALRLIPAIPFFAINLALGLTRIGWLTFYLVSQIGMLAGTAVYVNTGTQLAELRRVEDVLSPGLMLSFVLLALFPWLAKIAVAAARRRRLYARWVRPARFDRNLVVIGAGAAGLVSAYVGAAARAKVTLIESGRMGGDCLNHGCVPSKALIRSAKLAHQIRHADRYGLSATEPQVPFVQVFRRIREVIATVAPHDSVERYAGLGVEVLQGSARIVDPWTVDVTLSDGGKTSRTARAIVIATGAAPFVPPLPGLEEAGYLTSDTMWEAFADRAEAPRRLVVLGGGPIGCEFAQSFARLGSAVTQIEMAPRLLLKEDEDVAAFARAALERDGVRVLTGHRAVACGRDAAGRWIEAEAGGGRVRIGFDDLIVAVGRSARLTGFGLEELGIPVNRVVETNDYLETLYPNIYAAGDVAGPYQFTHAGAHQAWFAAVNALFGFAKRFRVDYRSLPWVTFLDPEIARVGLSEAEAKEKAIAHEVTRYGIDELDRAIADGAAEGFVKVLTVPGRDRILGVTIVGEHAGELIAEFVLAMRHGLGLGKILSTVHSYPTFAEANRYAAGAWRRAHLNPRALAWLERLHEWRRGRA